MVPHFPDCIHCKHYSKSWGRPSRKGAKAPEFEHCSLNIQKIPVPFEGDRFCESFSVDGCTCSMCMASTIGVLA